MRALRGELTIPDFSKFTETLVKIHEKVLPEEGGENAQYIPQLAEVNPN